LEIGPGDLTWPGVDEGAAATLLRELEFGSLLAELAPNAGAARVETVSAELVVTPNQLEAVLNGLRRAKRLAFNLGGDDAGAMQLKIKGAGEEKTYVFDG